MKKMLCLLLACLMLTALLSACDGDGASEMTAVTINAAEATEPEAADAAETAAPTETAAPAETTETEKKAEQPAQTNKTSPAAETPLATEAPETAPTEPREETPTQAPTEAVAPPTQPSEREIAPPATEPTAASFIDLRSVAVSCIGCPVSILYDAIGEPPNGSSYVPSIYGSGEDGELYYNGFAVYTFRENGAETVIDVD